MPTSETAAESGERAPGLTAAAFARKAIPISTLEALQDAARREGAVLTVASPVARNAILGLVRTAEHRLRIHGEYRAELTRWTRPGTGRRDGVPANAFGPWNLIEAVPLRDFGLGMPELQRSSVPFEPFPTIVVVSTPGDDRRAWIRAGQALQAVLLRGTNAGLAATPMGQPLEIPALRELVADRDANRWPQVIPRIGYAVPTPPTRRRRLDDVLMT